MRGIWGLDDRIYTEAEIEASEHLKWARGCGALTPVPEETESKAVEAEHDDTRRIAKTRKAPTGA